MLPGRNPETKEEGYTLIEVLLTIFIMGMILLLVNVILISLIRVSYDTDARMKVRQGVEFSLEVIRNNIKSASPATIRLKNAGSDVVECTTTHDNPQDCELHMSLAEEGAEIVFSRIEEQGKGRLRATWTSSNQYINLTSLEDIDVKSVMFSSNRNDVTGTVEIIIIVQADSSKLRSGGDPIVEDFYKQATIITRGQEL
ncbi:type II secretion system protein [Candidatus Dojkabacteria bacterium]|nr:type II secretion system protein [Candidatus Dojkabacteria bacterium]